METSFGHLYKQMYIEDHGPLMFYEYLKKTNKKLFNEWRNILEHGLKHPH